MAFKRKLKKIINRWYFLYDRKVFDHHRIYYSQDGEDAIFMKLCKKKKGLYVDIGCNHPKRYNNTYNLYLNGWRGINIDPNKALIESYNKERPNDINIVSGVAMNKINLTYFEFNENLLNTFDEKRKEYLLKHSTYELISTKKVRCQPLSTILSEIVTNKSYIDLMSIDTEGFDLEVLQSNDWDRFSPEYIMIEDIGLDLQFLNKSQIHIFLKDKDYKIIARTHNTSFYKK